MEIELVPIVPPKYPEKDQNYYPKQRMTTGSIWLSEDIDYLFLNFLYTVSA